MKRMNRDGVLRYCETRPAAVEDYPFGDGVAVFKVGGKMFALVNLDGPNWFVNLKCDPHLALELRERLAAVRPGYHTDKRHRNTVDLDVGLDADELRRMIDHSYELVVAGLTKKARAALGLDGTTAAPRRAVTAGQRSAEVEAWFESYDNPQRDLVLAVRDVVLGADERIGETIKWKAPTFVYKGNLASFFPKAKKHVTLMFHEGASLDDLTGILDGDGDTARSLKITSASDLDSKAPAIAWLVQSWIQRKDSK